MTHPIFHMVSGAPDPVAPFSHAVEADGWIFVTGQMPFSGASNTSAYPEGIEAQTRQVMENLKRVLAGCGLGLEHVVSARIFLTRFDEDYERMNAVYATYFARAGFRREPVCWRAGHPRPCRGTTTRPCHWAACLRVGGQIKPE